MSVLATTLISSSVHKESRRNQREFESGGSVGAAGVSSSTSLSWTLHCGSVTMSEESTGTPGILWRALLLIRGLCRGVKGSISWESTSAT